jgi:hypothetical protein
MAISEKNRTLSIVISLVLLGVAGTLTVKRMWPRSDSLQLGLMGVMSEGLAAEIETMNQGPARIVCVSRANSPSVFASEKAVATFRSVAEGEGHTVVAEAYIPISEMHSTDQGIQLTVANLTGLMSQYADATVIVSFVGVPYLGPGEAAQLAGDAPPHLVAVSYDDEQLDSLLADHVVDLAVVFNESTPVNKSEVTKAELEQFVTFRHAGEQPGEARR